MELEPIERLKAIRILKSFCVRFQSYELAAQTRDLEKSLMKDNGFSESDIPILAWDEYRITQLQFDYIMECLNTFRKKYTTDQMITEIRNICIPIIRQKKLDDLFD